jgi:hypothetical protein
MCYATGRDVDEEGRSTQSDLVLTLTPLGTSVLSRLAVLIHYGPL